MSSTNIAILAVIALIVFGSGLYFFLQTPGPEPEPEVVELPPEPEPEPTPEPEPDPRVATIGSSVEGRTIEAFTYGTGDTHLLLVGGIHGGYEWNSALLAYEFMDYLVADPTVVPEELTVTIIPDLNPDGTFLVTGVEGRFAFEDIPDPSIRVAEGRFNANEVDLNRNFDCKWEPESTWRGNVVSAGTEAFSEPEAAALRGWVAANNPAAAVFWHSQANNVYASECEEGVLPVTLDIMSAYAQAADYGEVPVFDAYPVTGDAEGWLASLGIPAITVELETHNDIEWERNLAGTTALFDYFATGSTSQKTTDLP